MFEVDKMKSSLADKNVFFTSPAIHCPFLCESSCCETTKMRSFDAKKKQLLKLDCYPI
jgi:hypothetical protein